MPDYLDLLTTTLSKNRIKPYKLITTRSILLLILFAYWRSSVNAQPCAEPLSVLFQHPLHSQHLSVPQRHILVHYEAQEYIYIAKLSGTLQFAIYYTTPIQIFGPFDLIDIYYGLAKAI